MGHDLGRAQSTVAPYSVALLASTAALALTFLVWPGLETTPSPLFFAAVVVSSCYGGLGPALLATALAALATSYFFVPPVHSLAIEEDLAGEPLQVLGDPTRLQQVVWNLAGNALKFTPHGGRVLVRLRRVHGCARLTVTDTGRGISAAFLPHVFEPFRQADGGTQQGLGLGLAIVRELVELHGGTIRAESAGEGRGARFTVIILPLAPAAKEALGGGSMTACAS